MLSNRRWTWPSPGSLVVYVMAYAAAAVAFTWPLARHLSHKLTGQTTSDLGLYLWNLWVFRHEVMSGHFPLVTSSIFSLDAPVDPLEGDPPP
jgi:hypothetical protein